MNKVRLPFSSQCLEAERKEPVQGALLQEKYPGGLVT
jgi:hypothetical protein